jgi:hypothetical protein
VANITEVPLSVIAVPAANYFFAVAIGTKKYLAPAPKDNSYWFSVYDRSTLDQVFSYVQTANGDAVPADLSGKFNTEQYLLVVTTCGLLSAYVPAGKLFSFLVDNGAGVALKRLTQVYQQFGCGSLGRVSYAMVGQLGPGLPAHPNLEVSSFTQSSLYLEVTLIGVTIGGKVFYTPAPLTQPKP